MTSAKLNATGYRWIAELANVNFDIKYRPGHANKDADFLSRMPRDIASVIEECTSEVSFTEISSIFTTNKWIHTLVTYSLYGKLLISFITAHNPVF